MRAFLERLGFIIENIFTLIIIILVILIMALMLGGLVRFNYKLIIVADILYIIAFKLIVAWRHKELNLHKRNLIEEGVVFLLISLLSLGVAFKHPFVIVNILILIIIRIMPSFKIDLSPKIKVSIKRKDKIHRES